MNYDEDTYFISLANKVKERSTCLRRKVGAVLVKDGQILSMSSNGAPDALGKCEKCFRMENNIPSGKMLDYCYAIHSELNVILEALKNGYDVEGSTIYVTCTPCINCAKLIIHCKIGRIVSSIFYADEFSLETLAKAGIKLEMIDNFIELNKEDEELINSFFNEKEPKLKRTTL